MCAGAAPTSDPNMDAETKILRRHYSERDFISSAEGILKVVSVVLCILVGVLALSAAACGHAAWLAGGALAAAAVLALLTAAALAGLPRRAPALWLYSDVTASALVGVLLLAAVVLGAVFCPPHDALSFVRSAVCLVTAGTVTAGAACGHAAAVRRLDEAPPAARAGPAAPCPPPADVDV